MFSNPISYPIRDNNPDQLEFKKEPRDQFEHLILQIKQLETDKKLLLDFAHTNEQNLLNKIDELNEIVNIKIQNEINLFEKINSLQLKLIEQESETDDNHDVEPIELSDTNKRKKVCNLI